MLTLRLSPRIEHLTAIEIDPQMVRTLTTKLPANVSLINDDFLEVDLDAVLQSRTRVVGNLPYNLSSPILFRLLDAHRTIGRLTDATLMVQREVADRITSAPGRREYGVLSILVQMHADVRRVLSLPPGAFRPSPKVHSAVVHFRFRPPVVAVQDDRAFDSLVRSMFTQRRKTLLNALAPFATARRREAGAALASAGIDPRRRPETLQLTELARLADYFASA